MVSNPYPNPVRAGEKVRVQWSGECSASIRWAVYTSAYRKIGEWTSPSDGTPVQWNLRDAKGKPVAAGLYYLVLTPEGGKTQTRTLLVLPE